MIEFETVRRPRGVKGYPVDGRGAKDRETEKIYLSRPFVAWDGEGVTLPDGSHKYVMLANSQGGYVANPGGLHTRTVFDFCLSERQRLPENAIHVIYGAGYDWNLWLASLSYGQLLNLYNNGIAHLENYFVRWRRGKSFDLRSETMPNIRFYDVLPFFQCSFVKACDEYLGSEFVNRDIVVENKANRSSFTLDDVDKVREYNRIELVNLVRLCEVLRERLNAVYLRPKRWDGPGAIAAALLTREKVQHARATIPGLLRGNGSLPPDVNRAARFAYAGGRFEVIRYGRTDEPAWEYDVNSAYPYALQHVPNLNKGRWVNNAPIRDKHAFALCRIRFRSHETDFTEQFWNPAPLFRRHDNGTISYPTKTVDGWFWASEYLAALQYAKSRNVTVELLETWVFQPDNLDDRPFAFIPELYAERQALKAAGDGAHVGIKLGLNSLYGKTAQQIGARYDRRENKWGIPAFHQIEWAGYTTALCRSMVFLAALNNLDAVIAYETDALFTSEPLPELSIGTGLGEWEETRFDNLTYIQSGIYFGDIEGKAVTAKTRGVDLGKLTRNECEKAMQQKLARDREVPVTLTRFITAGLALRKHHGRGMGEWGRWVTETRNIVMEPTGKRDHDVVTGMCCGQGEGTPFGQLHRTYVPFMVDAFNYARPVSWLPEDTPDTMSDYESLTPDGTEWVELEGE